MKDSGPPKPLTRLEPHRVKLVHSTFEPNRAKLEESVARPQISLEEAVPRLMESVEISYIDEPRCEN